VLHRARLVDRRREGRRVFYRLSGPETLALIRGLEAAGRAHLAEVEQLVSRYIEARDELDPVSPAALRRLMNEEDILVVDVRPTDEFVAGHIPGAVSLPPDEVRRRLARLPRDQEIVAYCRGPLCLFSAEAADLIWRSGRRVRRLSAGFPDWQSAGYPVETGPPR
jgi:ArsR family transcriptional regulator